MPVSGPAQPGVTPAQLSAALAGKADASAVPQPATAMPPAVQDASLKGVDTRYALADHTHASKARRQRVTGVTTATYTYVYRDKDGNLAPFAAGVVPVCNAIAEDPADSAADSYNVQVSGTPTNTQCVFRIKRQSSGLLGLISNLILTFNTTPGNINLHCSAFEP
jgi:hypothetical protein